MDDNPNAHKYVKKKLNATFRRHKSLVKKCYFDPFVDDESPTEMYAALPDFIDLESFKKCVEEMWYNMYFQVNFLFI